MERECHSCKYSGPIPYDVHISCCHPELDDLLNGHLADLLLLWQKFEIKANLHGINKGWFDWPWNFDPVWLENCNAFEEKE